MFSTSGHRSDKAPLPVLRSHFGTKIYPPAGQIVVKRHDEEEICLPEAETNQKSCGITEQAWRDV
jgi:hypothetical protein